MEVNAQLTVQNAEGAAITESYIGQYVRVQASFRSVQVSFRCRLFFFNAEKVPNCEHSSGYTGLFSHFCSLLV